MSDMYQILARLYNIQEGQDANQRRVDQLPALVKPKPIKVLDAPTDPQHPFKKYFVGGESAEDGTEVSRDELLNLIVDQRPEWFTEYGTEAVVAAADAQVKSGVGSAADMLLDLKHKLASGDYLGRGDVLEWASLGEGVSIADKFTIFEEFYTKGNLFESTSEDKRKYFESLFDLIDTPEKNQKYIVAPLALISNKVISLDTPAVMEFVGATRNGLAFKHADEEKSYPPKTIRELTIANTFTFSTVSAYNKLRSALALKFGHQLPELQDDETQELNEYTNKRRARNYVDTLAQAADDPDHPFHARDHHKQEKAFNTHFPKALGTVLTRDDDEERAMAQEDVIGKKKSLNDYLQDLATQVKKDPDILDRKPQDTDRLGPAVKTVKIDDGREIKIHGNEDDGFRISIKNKPSRSSFKSLDEAALAVEMFCRRQQAVNTDYLDEKQ